MTLFRRQVLRSRYVLQQNRFVSSSPSVPKAVQMLMKSQESATKKPTSFYPKGWTRHVGDDDNETDSADVMQAAHAVEKVLGIPQDFVLDMMRYAPTPSERCLWKDKLLTWKEIESGRDIPLPGCATFLTSEVYRKLVHERQRVWAAQLIRTVKVSRLQKAGMYLGMKRGLTLDQMIEFLCNSEQLDIARILAYADRKTGFTSTQFLHGKQEGLPETLAFPLFIDVHDSGLRTLNMRKLRLCSWSGGCSGAPFWLPSVPSLQARGHFSQTLQSLSSYNADLTLMSLEVILSQGMGGPQFDHVVRNFDWWKSPNNIGAINEISAAASDRKTNSDDYYWPEHAASMNPKELLDDLRERERLVSLSSGPDHPFDHLLDLEDSDKIHVLRSSHQVRNAAVEMRICAASYVDRILKHECVLFVFVDSAGKLLAMAEHPLLARWPEGGWSEMFGPAKRRPTPEIVEAFRRYERAFRNWHKLAYPKEGRNRTLPWLS